MDISFFARAKEAGRRIVSITCYDYWSARLLNRCPVDFLLVGDSLAMVMHGHPSTLAATVEMMALHTAAVARGAPERFVVVDMPFLSFRKGLRPAMDAAGSLMRAGASAVKVEGIVGHEDIVRHVVESGIPVMGHLGLIPQSVHALGGYRVQARDDSGVDLLRDHARRVEDAGCFALVLECVPSTAAHQVTADLSIPTIGIGAGTDVDGQILVLHDMLGLNAGFQARFVRKFGDGEAFFVETVEAFSKAVSAGDFPTADESYQ